LGDYWIGAGKHFGATVFVGQDARRISLGDAELPASPTYRRGQAVNHLFGGISKTERRTLMADYDIAFQFLMDDEDKQRTGEVVSDPTSADPKAVARFGINSHWCPEAVRENYYTMPHDEALEWAKGFYKCRYFAALLGYNIAVQDIANKYFDLAVNEGVEEATKIVQRACNQVSTPVVIGKLTLAVDGKPGQMTLATINKCAPEILLPQIKAYGAQFYRDVAGRLKWSPRQTAAMIARANR
jgi:hypothetical protein